MNTKEELSIEAGQKIMQRQERGEVSPDDIRLYENITQYELVKLLSDVDPRKRTIAAILIGNQRIHTAIPQLCHYLAVEEALYPRIAISEALGKMGESAVEPLIALLGKIGDNQETKLPEKYCAKPSFPLVRDMAARTLVKIGKPAIAPLIVMIEKGDSFPTQQAIDAVGGISSKTGNVTALPVVLKALVNYTTNEVTFWKIIRALSAFRCLEVVEPLVIILENDLRCPIRWEAARSLGQAGIPAPNEIRALQRASGDANAEVQKAARIALGRIAVKYSPG